MRTDARMPWKAICDRYPEQWVVMVDHNWDEDSSSKPKTARVLATGATRYMLCVQHFFALGFGFSDFQIHAHDMPDYGIDGLLGMNFLENFNFTGRPIDQQIDLEPVRPPSVA